MNQFQPKHRPEPFRYRDPEPVESPASDPGYIPRPSTPPAYAFPGMRPFAREAAEAAGADPAKVEGNKSVKALNLALCQVASHLNKGGIGTARETLEAAAPKVAELRAAADAAEKAFAEAAEACGAEPGFAEPGFAPPEPDPAAAGVMARLSEVDDGSGPLATLDRLIAASAQESADEPGSDETAEGADDPESEPGRRKSRRKGH